jgi:hypothetical protein
MSVRVDEIDFDPPAVASGTPPGGDRQLIINRIGGRSAPPTDHSPVVWGLGFCVIRLTELDPCARAPGKRFPSKG